MKEGGGSGINFDRNVCDVIYKCPQIGLHHIFVSIFLIAPNPVFEKVDLLLSFTYFFFFSLSALLLELGSLC